ncbi:hypothetical protein D3C83_286050 [compost metagenome]
MPDAIDHARGEERDPRHLHRPDRYPDEPEQDKIDDHQNDDAENRMRPVEVALDPVIRRALAVSLQRLHIA